MINLPKIADLDVAGKKILVRADLDVETAGTGHWALGTSENNLRLRILKSTIDTLFEKGAKQVILLGHRGRPKIANGLQTTDYSQTEGGKSLSLKVLLPKLGEVLGKEVKFIESLDFSLIISTIEQFNNLTIFLLENLRFHPGEETNNAEFAKKLAGLADCYVNEAFAASHREHASIVALPQQFKSKFQYQSVAAGLRFEKEVENLSKVFESPKRPVVVIISGIKEDKLAYIEPFSQFADITLVGGRLPEVIQSTNYKLPATKVLVAQLNPDKEDITMSSIAKFEIEIAKAGTIVLAGPIGKYEDAGHRLGTERIFKAVAKSSAFRIAGGGDTEAAINSLSLSQSFSWVSVGGGAMLEFLAKRTLLGITALTNS